MLLGKDDVILDIVPAYVTDALLRKVNVDRYDDREIIKTNLVESYGQLMEFARKHLPDKFFLEDDQRKNLRNIIAREMLVNTLIHREFTSPYIAKFVIEKERMYVENANRAIGEGVITPENLEPNPKNPIVASFFRNIGYSDQLGSGVRNLFKYVKLYSGKEPEFKEGDVFRIMVPLNETYSFDAGSIEQKNADKVPISADKVPISADKMPVNLDGLPIAYREIELTEQQLLIVRYLQKYRSITSGKAGEVLGIKQRRARDVLRELVEKGILLKQGSYKNTVYVLNGKQ